MEVCAFQCKKDANGKRPSTCGEAGTYELTQCDSANGGGQGFDVVMQGVGGGCAMGSDGETVKVTFS
jgi:hypothetical protein